MNRLKYLNKKMAKIEKKYESTPEKAVVVRAKLIESYAKLKEEKRKLLEN